jgi:allophanate hydrolase
VVERLIRAGAVPTLKTNLDQFATGLVGTRSPYGTPRNPFDDRLVPGGSSSGSAVAVALGLTTFALGTDTAGSGRVPAAMCGLFGLKPTPGWLSCSGVVPAVQSIDCVSVFSTSMASGTLAVELAAGHDPSDPFSRRPHPQVRGPIRRLGVLDSATLRDLDVSRRVEIDFERSCELLDASGYELVCVDPTDLFAIGDELYGGPWVSERLVVLDELLTNGASDLDPVVERIVSDARRFSAVDVHRARARVEALRQRVDELFGSIDALAFPTIGWHVSLDAVRRDPIGTNSRLGRFTTFTNLAGMCAVTLPLPPAADDPLPPPSLTLHAPAWSDLELADVAAGLSGEPVRAVVPDGWIPLAVAGAHLRGEALDHQLVDRGARFVETTTTAPVYRLYAMTASVPPKPAVVHVGTDGAAIEVDVWAVSPAALGAFLQEVPPPLCLGTVELTDGRQVTGFLSEPRALDGALDITAHGGWRAYRRHG